MKSLPLLKNWLSRATYPEGLERALIEVKTGKLRVGAKESDILDRSLLAVGAQ
jgi:hypothetical protein